MTLSAVISLNWIALHADYVKVVD